MLTSAKYRAEMSDLTSARAIPVTVIGNQVLSGFDRSQFEAALAQGKTE